MPFKKGMRGVEVVVMVMLSEHEQYVSTMYSGETAFKTGRIHPWLSATYYFENYTSNESAQMQDGF